MQKEKVEKKENNEDKDGAKGYLNNQKKRDQENDVEAVKQTNNKQTSKTNNKQTDKRTRKKKNKKRNDEADANVEKTQK